MEENIEDIKIWLTSRGYPLVEENCVEILPNMYLRDAIKEIPEDFIDKAIVDFDYRYDDVTVEIKWSHNLSDDEIMSCYKTAKGIEEVNFKAAHNRRERLLDKKAELELEMKETEEELLSIENIISERNKGVKQ